METTINQRIKALIGGSSKRRFAIAAGIAPTTFESVLKGTDPSYSTIVKILKTVPDLSCEWLILGEGARVKEGSKFSEPNSVRKEDVDKLEDQIRLLTETNRMLVEENRALQSRNNNLTDQLLRSLK